MLDLASNYADLAEPGAPTWWWSASTTSTDWSCPQLVILINVSVPAEVEEALDVRSAAWG